MGVGWGRMSGVGGGWGEGENVVGGGWMGENVGSDGGRRENVGGGGWREENVGVGVGGERMSGWGLEGGRENVWVGIGGGGRMSGLGVEMGGGGRMLGKVVGGRGECRGRGILKRDSVLAYSVSGHLWQASRHRRGDGRPEERTRAQGKPEPTSCVSVRHATSGSSSGSSLNTFLFSKTFSSVPFSLDVC